MNLKMYSEGTDLFTTPGAYARHFVKDLIKDAFQVSEIEDEPSNPLMGAFCVAFSPLLFGMGYVHCKSLLKKVTPDQANELEKELGEKLTIH
jgi:hypothetical protein